MVQMTTVSIKGSSKATKPSEGGWFVFAVLCAIAAEPTPASLENAARWKPTTKTPSKLLVVDTSIFENLESFQKLKQAFLDSKESFK